MLDKIKGFDHLFILICLYLAKIIIFSPSFADAVIFISALGYISYCKYLNQVKAVKINEDVLTRLSTVEESMMETRSSMNAMKMSGSMGGGVRFK